MKFTFQRMVAMTAVRNCYEAGATVPDLAAQTGLSVSTIRRWLKVTGAKGRR